MLSLVLAGQETLSYSSKSKPTNNEIANVVHCGGRNRGRSTTVQNSMHSDPAVHALQRVPPKREGTFSLASRRGYIRLDFGYAYGARLS